MKALRFDRVGGLEALVHCEVPRSRAVKGEVVVHVQAAGVNPSDVKNVLGAFPYTTLPRTPGRDFAGEVVEGPSALVGKAVWGTGKELGFTRDGSHAEYLALPERGVALKPVSLSFIEAAACGVPYVTAFDALERGGVDAGTRLVVVGANGAVGRAAVNLARARKARVVGAVRNATHASELEARGVAALILGRPEALPDRARAAFAAAGEGAELPDVVFDTTGHWLATGVRALAPFGRVVVIAPGRADGLAELPVLDLYRRGGIVVGVNSMLYDVCASARMLERFGAQFDDGSLAPPLAPVVRPLGEGPAVFTELHQGASGKVVFVSTR